MTIEEDSRHLLETHGRHDVLDWRDQNERIGTFNGHQPGPDDDDDDLLPFIDWAEFWNRERHDEEWLIPDVFALSRGHALYAAHKEGKSLFVLCHCAHLAATRTDVDVIYMDYEMSDEDVWERLDDMGYGPDSDLTRLHYWLLPALPPLDTGEGMAALLEIVDQVQRPDCPLLVVIDTTGRAVEGDENSADTIRAFYRWTGTALKRRGITWGRVDHSGKDATRGQRGSSAKGDDVDIIWKLQQNDDGITLHRDAARMSWVPEKVTFAIATNPLRYERSDYSWPAGTKELARQLDKLDVPIDASRHKTRPILRQAGITAQNRLVDAAIRWRREQPQTLAVQLAVQLSATPSVQPTVQTTNTALTSPVQPAVQSGPTVAASAVRTPPLVGVQDAAEPEPTRRCDRCGQPSTDISGRCNGCLANPGELEPFNAEDTF